MAGASAEITSTYFYYDASGQRIRKEFYSDIHPEKNKITYYIKDAQGNIMSTYEKANTTDPSYSTFKQLEIPIYGSSRLGVYINDQIDAMLDPIKNEHDDTDDGGTGDGTTEVYDYEFQKTDRY